MSQPTLWQPADSWRPGGAWGICDRCAFKYRLSTLQTEWSGAKVCKDCFDPPPRETTPPNLYPEGLAIPDGRPDPGDVLGPNLTTPDDL